MSDGDRPARVVLVGRVGEHRLGERLERLDRLLDVPVLVVGPSQLQVAGGADGVALEDADHLLRLADLEIGVGQEVAGVVGHLRWDLVRLVEQGAQRRHRARRIVLEQQQVAPGQTDLGVGLGQIGQELLGVRRPVQADRREGRGQPGVLVVRVGLRPGHQQGQRLAIAVLLAAEEPELPGGGRSRLELDRPLEELLGLEHLADLERRAPGVVEHGGVGVGRLGHRPQQVVGIAEAVRLDVEHAEGRQYLGRGVGAVLERFEQRDARLRVVVAGAVEGLPQEGHRILRGRFSRRRLLGDRDGRRAEAEGEEERESEGRSVHDGCFSGSWAWGVTGRCAPSVMRRCSTGSSRGRPSTTR